MQNDDYSITDEWPSRGLAPTVNGDVARMEFTNNFVTIFDAEDVPIVTQWLWTVGLHPRTKKAYVYAVGHRDISLHRYVMDARPGQLVDHIDGDTLHNRKVNLRVATNQENMQNRAGANANSQTGVRGVSKWSPPAKKPTYMAHIAVGPRVVSRHFPFTPEGLAQATQCVQDLCSEYSVKPPRVRSDSETHVPGVNISRAQIKTYWMARVYEGSKARTKYFPYTDEGLKQADQAVVAMRNQYMTHSR